jgi:chromate transporter
MTAEPIPPKPTIPQLMVSFLRVGLTSFGGSTGSWVFREVVTRRGWMSKEAFATALTVAQILPGANPVNLSLYIGSQLRGGLGGIAAALGMVVPAFCVILILGALYGRFGGNHEVHIILGGLAAVGVGMTLSVGVKLAKGVKTLVQAAIAVVIFIAVGIGHWPTIPVVLVFTPLSIGLELLASRKPA